METTFTYDKYVTGKKFLGRKQTCTTLANLLGKQENVYIYDAPKSGKMSVIQQTLFNMRIAHQQFIACEVSILNVRSIKAFLKKFGATVIRAIGSTPQEYAEAVTKYLSDSAFFFDTEEFSDKDEILCHNEEISDDDIRSIIMLPYKIAEDKGQSVYVILSEFQNLDLTENGERVYKAMEGVLKEMRDKEGFKCAYVFCGSMINAMKNIFDVKKFFYKQAEYLPLQDLDEQEIILYIVNGFNATGKITSRELLAGICRLFRNNLWYINHFVSICEALSKGYIMEPILLEALDKVLAVHQTRFMSIVNDLTTYQLNFLRAVLDGHIKFSASDVIEEYGLNSSANVRRLKDALMKKEIITFNDKDFPIIIDPLFEYWVKKFYFEMKQDM